MIYTAVANFRSWAVARRNLLGGLVGKAVEECVGFIPGVPTTVSKRSRHC